MHKYLSNPQVACMAQIELRHATIRFKDGLSGTSLVNLPGTALDPVPVTTTQEGGGGSDEVQVIKQYVNDPTGGTFTLTFDVNGNEVFTTAGIAFDANAATIEAAIDAAASGVVTSWTNGDITVSGGPLTTTDVTLTFDGTSVANFNHDLTTIDPAGLTGVDPTGLTQIAIDNITLNTDDTDLVPVGARFTVASETGSPTHIVTARAPSAVSPTTHITFSTALAAGVLDNALITFAAQQVEIKLGEGNLTYTENKEYEYVLDKGNLDTVREGNQVPVDVALDFVYEFIRTGTGETITPTDALKGVGGAAEWVSSSSDLCEPYAVDLEVEYTPPCGGSQKEITLFPDFRGDTINPDLSAGSISVAGRSNATEPVVTRV